MSTNSQAPTLSAIARSRGNPGGANRRKNRPPACAGDAPAPAGTARHSRSGPRRRRRTARPGRACPRNSPWPRASGGRHAPGSCPPPCRRASAGPGRPPRWPASRNAAARWPSRRRTTRRRARWPAAPPRPHARSRRSSACRDSLPHTCSSMPIPAPAARAGWRSSRRRSVRCGLPGGGFRRASPPTAPDRNLLCSCGSRTWDRSLQEVRESGRALSSRDAADWTQYSIAARRATRTEPPRRRHIRASRELPLAPHLWNNGSAAPSSRHARCRTVQGIPATP